MSLKCASTTSSNSTSVGGFNGVPGNDNYISSLPVDAETQVLEIEFGKDSSKNITEMLNQFDERHLSGVYHLHAVRQVARRIYQSSSPTTRDAFAKFAYRKTDVIVAKNLFAVPSDLEPTPNDRNPCTQSRLLALPPAALGLLCGTIPVAVTTENHGEIDRHVRATVAYSNTRSSAGGAEIGKHNEHSYRNHGDHGKLSPQVDTLSIAGLRNRGLEPTGYAVLFDVLSYIRPQSIAILEEPVFGMAPPDSSDATATNWNSPILYRRHGHLECAYREDKVHIPPRQDARQAIDDLNDSIMKAARTVILTPGTVWLARNPRCFHWRDTIRDRSRWLVRTFGLAPNSTAIFPDPNRPELIEY